MLTVINHFAVQVDCPPGMFDALNVIFIFGSLDMIAVNIVKAKVEHADDIFKVIGRQIAATDNQIHLAETAADSGIVNR